MSKEGQQSPKRRKKRRGNNDYMKLPFWCGYLPDKDACEMLNYRNEFILRRLEEDHALCVTICVEKNKIQNVQVVEDNSGFNLQNQRPWQESEKDLIEFYWCTKMAINVKGLRLRLEVPILRPRWLLFETNFTYGPTIGTGAYGIVIKALYQEVGERYKVAVKQLRDDLPAEELDNLWKEARIMKSLIHKNIVSFIGILNDHKPFSLVMECVNGSSVDNYLKKEGSGCDNKTRLHILIEAAKGMNFLHSLNPPFLHLDLAARNLLIHWTTTLFKKKTRENMVIKVADFGLSKQATRAKIDTSQPTNIRWIDPHSFITERVDKQTDVWAFAVTMFELFVRPYQMPYRGWDAQKVFHEVIEPEKGKRKHLDRPRGMPIEVYHIMRSCMQLDEKREQRPTFTDLLEQLETVYSKQK